MQKPNPPKPSSILLLLITTMPLWLITCKPITPEAPARTQLDSTLVPPLSELNVPVYYPINELEAMVNEKLNARIIEAKLAISQKDDSLFLSIARFKPVTIVYNGDRGISYSIPLQIEGNIRSKVMGIKVQNKTPISAKVIISLYSDLYLDKRWDLTPKTRIEKIEWVEDPKINIAGVKINLKPTIEKALLNNEEKITQKLDESARNILKIRKAVEQVWTSIQKPIRINKKVVPVWLKADISKMEGSLLRRSRDTLMIEIGLTATLSTELDSAVATSKPKPLPPLRQLQKTDGGLNTYLLATIPFDKLNTVLAQVTDTMKFNFKGRSARIESSEVYGTSDGLAIKINLRGDVRADVYLRGSVGFDSVSQKLVIENFGFDVNSEHSLLQAADWLAHDEIIDRLQPYMSLPLENLFTTIPDLITRGIKKGKLGEKIDVRFEDFIVSFYGYLITTDNIQVILAAKGKANIGLQKKIFEKKKKPVS
ncbi:MAG TPA: DUF4403 family protein [Ohtaekwangia sp.]